MKYSKRFSHFFIIVVLSLFASAYSASAVTLQEAKKAGSVGEQANGYVGVVAGASAGVQALVQSVNQKRRNKYQSIAKANGTSLQAVEAVAGKKTMRKTAAGQYIQRNGRWVRK